MLVQPYDVYEWADGSWLSTLLATPEWINKRLQEMSKKHGEPARLVKQSHVLPEGFSMDSYLQDRRASHD